VLSTCHDIISNLRNKNAKLIAKVEKLDNCDDSIVSLRNDNANLIAKIDNLNASLSSLKIENEKFKFARSMIYSGRRPGIKDGIGFQQGDNVKLSAPMSNFVKGKAPMV
jgi:hypothetical protein